MIKSQNYYRTRNCSFLFVVSTVMFASLMWTVQLVQVDVFRSLCVSVDQDQRRVCRGSGDRWFRSVSVCVAWRTFVSLINSFICFNVL